MIARVAMAMGACQQIMMPPTVMGPGKLHPTVEVCIRNDHAVLHIHHNNNSNFSSLPPSPATTATALRPATRPTVGCCPRIQYRWRLLGPLAALTLSGAIISAHPPTTERKMRSWSAAFGQDDNCPSGAHPLPGSGWTDFNNCTYIKPPPGAAAMTLERLPTGGLRASRNVRCEPNEWHDEVTCGASFCGSISLPLHNNGRSGAANACLRREQANELHCRGGKVYRGMVGAEVPDT